MEKVAGPRRCSWAQDSFASEFAAIEEPAVIARILTHLGLPTRAPPRSPARRPDLFQAA
jgi:hypothetical protein